MNLSIKLIDNIHNMSSLIQRASSLTKFDCQQLSREETRLPHPNRTFLSDGGKSSVVSYPTGISFDHLWAVAAQRNVICITCCGEYFNYLFRSFNKERTRHLL